VKRLLVGGAILALGVAGMAQSQAAPAQWKVTGGGQITVSLDENGDPVPVKETIAFNARSTDADGGAQGQLQYNSHDGTKFHGTVSCLVVDGNRATFAGVVTNGDNEGDVFQVDVLDNGEGAEAAEDMILLTNPDDADCGDPQDPTGELGHGNVQVHKENAPKDGS
jgi:hypothetical protein